MPTNFEVLASLLAGGQEYPFSKKEKCYFWCWDSHKTALMPHFKQKCPIFFFATVNYNENCRFDLIFFTNLYHKPLRSTSLKDYKNNEDNEKQNYDNFL